MSWWNRKKSETKSVDPQVADRLETVTRRLETFTDRLERELHEIKTEGMARG
jgi:hypothetical protein